MGRDEGVTEDQLQALHEYESSPVFTPEQRAVLRFVDGLTSTPCNVPDESFVELRRHYDDEQIVELTSALAWENFRARFDHSLGFESEGFSDGAFCPLPGRVQEGAGDAMG